MHDGKVLRRPEGHDSETVEEEELVLGKGRSARRSQATSTVPSATMTSAPAWSAPLEGSATSGSMQVVCRENPAGRA